MNGYIDSHAHLNALTWANLEEMSLAGIREIVSPVMLDAGKAVYCDTIVEMWDYLLEVQLPRAAEHFIIHTPNPPEEKRQYTDRVLELCAACRTPMTQVAIDHGSAANLERALQAGAHVAVSVQPFRGMTPELACELILAHGFDRILLNSDCSPLPSDPLAVPKTAQALRRRGVAEERIDKVCRRNSQEFYRI